MLNAGSYFFTMRPARAFLLIFCTMLMISPAVFAPQAEVPDWLGLSWVLTLLFAPLAINAGLLIRHSQLLGKPARAEEVAESSARAMPAFGEERFDNQGGPRNPINPR